MAKKDDMSIESFNKEVMDKILNKEGKISSLSDETSASTVKSYISTGSTILDYRIANQRNGGIPVGRITEISGESASGKSLLAFQIIANAQKLGAPVFYADTESAADANFMKRVGIQLEKLPTWHPPTLEQFFEKTEQIIIKTRETFPNKERPVVIVLDSVAATPTEVESEGTYDANGRPGLLGKSLSLGLKKLNQIVGNECVTLILLNQLRMKFNVTNPYEDKYITPGGMAAGFYASLRMRLYKSSKVKDPITEDIIGVGCRAKIEKNKMAPAHRIAEFNIMFDKGIDNAISVYDYLKDVEVIKKKSGNTIFNATKFGVDFETEIPTSEWRKFFKEKQNIILNLLDVLLIKDYPDTESLEVGSAKIEKEESP